MAGSFSVPLSCGLLHFIFLSDLSNIKKFNCLLYSVYIPYISACMRSITYSTGCMKIYRFLNSISVFLCENGNEKFLFFHVECV